MACQEVITARRARVRSLGRRASAQEVAVILGVTARTVERDRDKLGLSLPNAQYSPEQWSYAERLLEDGTSYGETARTTRIPYSVLRRRFPGRGLSPAEVSVMASARIRARGVL